MDWNNIHSQKLFISIESNNFHSTKAFDVRKLGLSVTETLIFNYKKSLKYVIGYEIKT